MRRPERTIAIVLFVMATAFFVSGYLVLKKPLPEPKTFSIPLLEEFKTSAEIRPENQVKPGTFKIEIPLEEMAKEILASGKKVLVVYGSINRYYNPGSSESWPKVDYWLERADGGFYHSEEWFPVDWPASFRTGEINLKNDRLVAKPQRQSFAFNFFFTGLFTFLGVVVIWDKIPR